MTSPNPLSLSKYERPIMLRYLLQRDEAPAFQAYQVRLGRGLLLPADAPDWEKRLVAALSRKRVDALLEFRDGLYIVEVKSRAGSAAIGQLYAYATLLLDQAARGKTGIDPLLMTDPDWQMAWAFLERLQTFRVWQTIVHKFDSTVIEVKPQPSVGVITSADVVTFQRAHPGILHLVSLAERMAADMDVVYRVLGIEMVLV